MSKPRFTVDLWSECRVAIQDNDFGWDAALELSGDFANPEDKIIYAEAVAEALNRADIPKAKP